MKRSPWYTEASRVLEEMLAEIPANAGAKAICKAVREAYPFGMRKYWPYKKWCEARRAALHLKYPALFAAPKARPRKTKRKTDAPGQGRLFLELVAAGVDHESLDPSEAADAA